MAPLHAHHFSIVLLVDIGLALGGTCIFYAMYQWQESIWRRERHIEAQGFPLKLQEKTSKDVPPGTNGKI